MGSKQSRSPAIKPTTTKPDKPLTAAERVFVNELIASDFFNPTQAARKAGYKRPAQAANRLLKRKRVQRALGNALKKRLERCELKADNVLQYLWDVLMLNPLKYFRPTKDGHWEITDPDVLPEEVARLIEEMQVVVHELPDGTIEHRFRVKTVSKATALSLAMKHFGVDRYEVRHTFDWDRLFEYLTKQEREVNPVEAEIKALELKADQEGPVGQGGSEADVTYTVSELIELTEPQ